MLDIESDTKLQHNDGFKVRWETVSRSYLLNVLHVLSDYITGFAESKPNGRAKQLSSFLILTIEKMPCRKGASGQGPTSTRAT